MIYLDASALVKLAVVEAETHALREWLAKHRDIPRVTSELARVEVPRAVMRAQPEALVQAQQVVARTRKIALRAPLLMTAAGLQPPTLRSLDAIHLASALRVRDDLVAFVAYDERLLGAAKEFELPTARPA